MGFDVVIVGGGSAGCVLAPRLSEDASRTVLLIEAGPDYPSVDDLPPEIADGSFPVDTHDWGYASAPDVNGRTIRLLRGRLMGGCSSTNACLAVRGSPADYDAWASVGNEGWSFDEVMPFFRTCESDREFGDRPWHGRSGPLPIRRDALKDLAPAHAAALEAAATLGHPMIEDHNAPWAVGAGVAPVNRVDGVRMSTALTYLAEARDRPNLTIRPNVRVDRVLFDGVRTTAVVLAGATEGERIEAGTVVLAGGSYGSPAILQRSGLGPAADLAAAGVPLVADLPGVGRNLIDHAWLSVDVPADPPHAAAPLADVLITLHSADADPSGPPDIQLMSAPPIRVPSTESPTGALLFVGVTVLKPAARGRVSIVSPDPASPPAISPEHLGERHDVARAVEGIRVARLLLRTAPLSDLVRGAELRPAPGVPDEDDVAIEHALLASVGTYHHPVGTCRMGVDDMSVVDPGGRVHGVDGLRVCDASVMPDIPSANTNLPTIMVAERIAALMRREV